MRGKLITLYDGRIAINALKYKKEAEIILEWLKREINEGWKKRDQIGLSYESATQPLLMDILKLLPRKIGCEICGQ